jgi:hypothetical protein
MFLGHPNRVEILLDSRAVFAVLLKKVMFVHL